MNRLRTSKLCSKYIFWTEADGGFFFRCWWRYTRRSFKICHKPSYEWAVVTKTVHQLKFLKLSIFSDGSSTMARVIAIYQKHMTTYVVITLPAPDNKCPMNSFSRSVPVFKFHNGSPSVTEDIEIWKSYMNALPSCHLYLCFSPMEYSM